MCSVYTLVYVLVSRRPLVCVGVSLDMKYQNIKLFGGVGGGRVGGVWESRGDNEMSKRTFNSTHERK